MGQIDIEQEQDLMRHPHPLSSMRSGAPAPVLKQGGLLDKQRRLITLVNKDKECYQQHIYISYLEYTNNCS